MPAKRRDPTVPIFVPTSGVEALFTVAIATCPNPPKSLKTSNLAQLRAIVSNASKLLILRGSLVRDQEVGGSNPLAPTIYSNWNHWITAGESFVVSAAFKLQIGRAHG